MKLIPESSLKKFNGERCVSLQVTREGLQTLKERYHDARGQPAFIDRLLHLDPRSYDAMMLREHPEQIMWLDQGKLLVLPNYPCVDPTQLATNPKCAKDSKYGLALNVWFVHPTQLEGTVFSDEENRKNFAHASQSASFVPQSLTWKHHRHDEQKRIRELERKSGVPYIASILDLDQSHIPWLKSLRTEIKKHLREDYGVTSQDRVEIFSHGLIADMTTTWHLHVRVNQRIHPLERKHAFSLDEIIQTLEKGGTMEDMILSRGEYMRWAENTAEWDNIRGVHAQIIDNPYFMENPRAPQRHHGHSRSE